MNHNQATLHAVTRNIIKFKNWIGYFYWNYKIKEMNFRNGDYHLNSINLMI